MNNKYMIGFIIGSGISFGCYLILKLYKDNIILNKTNNNSNKERIKNRLLKEQSLLIYELHHAIKYGTSANENYYRNLIKNIDQEIDSLDIDRGHCNICLNDYDCISTFHDKMKLSVCVKCIHDFLLEQKAKSSWNNTIENKNQ